MPSSPEEPELTVLNEATIAGTQHRIHSHAAALYVHVGDVVVLGSSPQISDSILSQIVAALVRIGFAISQIIQE